MTDATPIQGEPQEPQAEQAPDQAEPEAVAEGQPEVQERIGALERERDEYRDSLQRLKADFDNYRKRAARDQESLATRAAESLVKELLPVVDDLERALVAAEEHEEAQLEDGVRLVHQSLVQTLRKHGLQQIETEGPFDPHVHEALLSQPSDAEEGSVIDVLQKGYRLGDRVLRPARVVIAERKQEEEPRGGEDE